MINADDFGYGEEVNAATAAALERGKISSATIMANGEGFEEAIRLVPQFEKASFGIHLNLTEFRPLLPIRESGSCGLVDSDGCFRGSAFRGLRPSTRLAQLCFEEMDQQLQRLHSRGIKPSHLDSHHHIHTIPWLLPVIHTLQRKYGIYKLRTTMNVYAPSSEQQASWKLLAAKRVWRLASQALGARMAQRFTSLQIFLADPHRDEFSKARSIELMCHPGQGGFAEETAELFRDNCTILPSAYRLVNYHEIGERGKA